MTLQDYIEILKTFDPEEKLAIGLGRPHSWRGDYNDLSFEPVENVTIGEMLASAEECIGKTFYGWKGGEFVMSEYTKIHVDYVGRSCNTGLYLLLLFLRQSSSLDPQVIEEFKSRYKVS